MALHVIVKRPNPPNQKGNRTMALAEEKPASEKPKRKILVRGADGALYLLTHKDLAPFKLEEDKAEKVTKILEKAHENPVVTKLPARVIEELDLAKAVAISIVCVSGEIFTNTVRKQQ
jgi:hypothetical protein